MITREWILITVIVLQLLGLAIFLIAIVPLLGSSFLGAGVFADLGGMALMIWVSVSHFLLLKRYKELKAERA